MSTASNLDRSINSIEKFIELSHRFVSMAMVDGFSLVPYRTRELPYFSQLPATTQESILQQMELMIQVGEKLHSEKDSIRGASKFAWSFCNAIGLRPPSDLYARIPENCVIDIYDSEHKLVFACLEFFELVSYSLEELYSRPWMELFARDTSTTHEILFKLSEQMLNGIYSGPVDTSNIGSHVLREASHPDLRWVRIQPRLFSPLYRDHKVAGYICANEIVELSVGCMETKRSLNKED